MAVAMLDTHPSQGRLFHFFFNIRKNYYKINHCVQYNYDQTVNVSLCKYRSVFFKGLFRNCLMCLIMINASYPLREPCLLKTCKFSSQVFSWIFGLNDRSSLWIYHDIYISGLKEKVGLSKLMKAMRVSYFYASLRTICYTGTGLISHIDAMAVILMAYDLVPDWSRPSVSLH